jgi:hypothetical protein
MQTDHEPRTHTATAWGIEYADGSRQWFDDEMLRGEALHRDLSLALRYPEDDVMPVAMLKREVTTTTTLTITEVYADAD